MRRADGGSMIRIIASDISYINNTISYGWISMSAGIDNAVLIFRIIFVLIGRFLDLILWYSAFQAYYFY